MIHSNPFFDNQGNTTEAFSELLDLCGCSARSIVDVRDSTQREWYKEGKFRAQIVEEHAGLKDRAWPLFRRLGMIDEINAPGRNYLHAILLGATVTAVRGRIDLLRREYDRGVRFVNFDVPGSDRALFADKESRETLLNGTVLPIDVARAQAALPTTEIGMMEWLCTHSRTYFPWTNRPRFCPTYGNGKSVTTADTLKTYRRELSPSGNCLLISSQPFAYHQYLVAQAILPDHCPIDVIGYAAPSTMPVTTVLDTVAKTVFELAQLVHA